MRHARPCLAWLVGLASLSGAACKELSHEAPQDLGAGDSGVSEQVDASVPPRIVGPALKVRIRSSDDLQPIPSRIIVAGVRPTPTPDYHKDGASASLIGPDVLAIPDGVLLVSGEAVVPIPPGTYDLTLLQGPEYEQISRRVTVGLTEVVSLDEILEHSVRTDGWLAADMHIHTSRSPDSRLLPAHRVITEVAAGVEVLVPTDHIWHNDLQPFVQALGYSARAVSIPGAEYGFNGGHLGVYPVHFDPKGPLWGAPAWQDWSNWNKLTPDVVFGMIHAMPEQPLVVVNHPRLLPDLGYFINVGWPHRPGEPLATAAEFDGLEVINGYGNLPDEITPLLRDWFFFLGQGYKTLGIGSSDTHRVDWLSAGYPRTWLRLATDDPQQVVPDDLREALRQSRAVASSGPFLQLRVDGHDIGDTFKPAAGTVSVEVIADAAGWIDLSRVLLYQNGVLVKEWTVPGPKRTHPALRVQASLPVSSDGWVVAMAVGDQPLPTSVIGAVRGGSARPFALTNPIWFDSDGDGKVQPPQTPLDDPPHPFGPVLKLLAPQADGPRATVREMELLHPPLDCAPDEWLEWLERASPSH